MINIIQSEYLKYKRTFKRKLILLAPLFFILIALPTKFLMPPDFLKHLKPWQLLLGNGYNWWSVLFTPMGIALFAALVQSQEKKAGNYRGLLLHNISPSAIWTGKIAVMAIHTFLTTLVLIVVIIISGVITVGKDIPWLKIFAGGFTIWLTSLPLIPLQLWAATWKGTAVSIALGIFGLIIGAEEAPKPYWIYVPWSWPMRLLSPITGVHPNGIPLSPGDPLLDSSVIPVGIAVSIITLVVFTFLTAIWFNKEEVK
ncbi:lantibiotic immunity ABC transporter MutE/EpiE family permease subunit [Aceticella autotrophica]|uniref:Lantibiotic immunity ABC transporter MutE/EpiE family permease subunit n=1 Tax=Aceticella autotrophica TaxID=2755338 RepID=A0A975AVW1_9THEO|nr:lantibiotic immunity ABC transporter MutE/EpiE family permease subunit [Aceticella autotrophica]QSZ27439.1 lantibiotic immunity ABC transporter MutE/EpiE family permease subunit [Aceticella autotrophica]